MKKEQWVLGDAKWRHPSRLLLEQVYHHSEERDELHLVYEKVM
jgi:hypothetical protein